MGNRKIDNRPVHLYFGREFATVLEVTPERQDKIDKMSHKVFMCNCWSELTGLMEKNPVSICFSEGELKNSSAVEIVNMIRTLSKLVNILHEINITIDVSKDTKFSDIKVYQKSGIFGIVPRACEFGWEETERSLHALWAKIPYWPKHIINQLPGAKKPQYKVGSSEIKLTPRQAQIVSLIKERGASNKIIAKTLSISESTVKLHVGIVLKKYGVKNRTQLALFSK